MITKNNLILGMTLLITMATVFPAQAKSFQGKVVDVETGKPIEGAVVLLVWYKSHGFSGSEYFKSRETVTDKSGMFHLEGRNKINFNPLTRVNEPHLHIFKSGGYKYFANPWVVSVFKKDYMKKWISFEDDLIIFKLKKLLTIEERKRNLPGVSSEIPYKMRKSIMKEQNKEEKALGLDLSTY